MGILTADKKAPAKFILLFSIISVGAIVSLWFNNGTGFVYSLFFLTTAFIILANRKDVKEAEFLVMVFVCAFLLRSACVYLLHRHSLTRNYGGFVSGDDFLYSIKALKLAFMWQGLPYNNTCDLGRVDYGLNPFTYFLAAFYRFVEPNYYASKLMNALLGNIAPLFFYLIARKIFSLSTARMTFLVINFCPSIVRWSAGNLKDPVINLFTGIIIYLLFTMNKGWRVLPKYLAVAILLYLLRYLQEAIFLAFVGAIALFLLYRFVVRFKKEAVVIVILAAIIFLALGHIFYTEYKDDIFRKLYNLVERQLALSASDNSGYTTFDKQAVLEIEAHRLNILSLFRVYGRGVYYFLFSPFPWYIKSLEQVVAYPQIIAWYLFFCAAIIGFLRGLSISRDKTVFMFLFLFICISLFSMVEGNMGASFRHRDFFTPLIFIYGCEGMRRIFIKAPDRESV